MDLPDIHSSSSDIPNNQESGKVHTAQEDGDRSSTPTMPTTSPLQSLPATDDKWPYSISTDGGSKVLSKIYPILIYDKPINQSLVEASSTTSAD